MDSKTHLKSRFCAILKKRGSDAILLEFGRTACLATRPAWLPSVPVHSPAWRNPRAASYSRVVIPLTHTTTMRSWMCQRQPHIKPHFQLNRLYPWCVSTCAGRTGCHPKLWIYTHHIATTPTKSVHVNATVYLA